MSLQEHLYKECNVSDILESYIQKLISTGRTEDFNHANKLRSYKHLIADTEFLDELHGLFVEMYRLLIKLNPELNFYVEGRQKSVISIEGKIQRYQYIGRSLDQIADIIAFRIVFWEKEIGIDLIPHCYIITEQIIDFFASRGFTACEGASLIGVNEQNPENKYNYNFKYKNVIKDYVCFPKNEKETDAQQAYDENIDRRYRSIHIVLVSPDGKKFEIQLRTSLMDAIADDYDHLLYKRLVNKGFDLTIDSRRINVPGYHNERKDFSGIQKSKPIFPR